MARFLCVALLIGSCAAQNDEEDVSGGGGDDSGDQEDLSGSGDTAATPSLTTFSPLTDSDRAAATPTGGGCPDAPDTGFAVVDPDAGPLGPEHASPHRNATCTELRLHGGCNHPAHGEQIRERCAFSCGVMEPAACWTEPAVSTADGADAGDAEPNGLVDVEIVWLAVIVTLTLGTLVGTVLIVQRRSHG